jgi:GAF domain-containing protein
MNEDELKRSLEGLFSDVAPPAAAPATPEDAQVQREPPEPEAPEEERAALDAELPPESAEPKLKVEVPDEPISPFPGEIGPWRPRLLQLLTYAAVAVGIPTVTVNVYDAYASGQLVLIPFWLCSYLILILIAFAGRIPYGLRTGTFLGLIYGLGLFDLVQSGHSGNSRMLLLSIPVLAVTLLSQQAGIATLFVTFVTQAVSAWAVSTNRFVPLGQRVAASGLPDRWWSSPAVFLVAGSGLVLAQTRLIPRLANALTRSRELGRNLADYQARLGGQKSELRRRALQLEAGVELGRVVTSVFDVDELLRRAAELIPDYFGCYFAGVFLLDETGDRVVLRAGTGDVWMQMAAEGLKIEIEESSIIGWTARNKVSYVALDVDKNERYRPHLLLPKTGSEVTLPLIFNGRLLGVLDVRAKETMAFDETDIRVLRGVADQLAIAIQNARHASDDAALLEATSTLYRASRRLTRATTVDEVVDAIVDSVAETEADGCLVLELTRSPAGELDGLRYLSTWRQRGQPPTKPGTTVPLDDSLFPLELLDDSWTVTDVENDDRLSRTGRQMLLEMEVEALVSIPLGAGDDRIGQVVALSSEPASFSASSMRLYEMLGDEAAGALDRARLLQRAQHGAQQEETLRRVVDRVRRAADIEQALRAAAGELSDAMDVPRVSIELDLGLDDELQSAAPSVED